MYGRTQGGNHWFTGQGAYFYKPHGTAEFDHADANAPVHPAHERFLEEVDEFKSCLRFAFRTL